MRSWQRSVTACLAGLAVSAHGGEQKPSGSAVRDPFAVKSAARASTESARRIAFEKDVQGLATRIAAARTRTPEQLSGAAADAVRRLVTANGGLPSMVWNEGGTLPIFISGRRLQSSSVPGGARTVGAAEMQAWAFLRENAALLRVSDPAAEFERIGSTRDDLGFVHVRFRQVFRGTEVWGREVNVHIGRDGNVESFNGRWIPTPMVPDVAAAAVSEASARVVALASLGRGSVGRSVPMILEDHSETRLTWMVQVRGRLDENWHLFVDAATGEIVKRYNHVMMDGPVSGSGTDLANQTQALNVYQIGSTYYLIDASKTMFKPATSTFPNEGKGVIYTLDAKNTDSLLYFVTAASPTAFTTTKPAVTAAFYGSKVYDYFKTAHNRDAIDGNGSTINMVVNYAQNYNNAFWNGQMMVFGGGDGTDFSNLAAGIDVMAHEMTHGVVERTANLVYENQPGALNESFADVFGVLYEFYVRGGGGNWLLGEDVTTPAIAGDVLRSMQDPGAANVAFGGQQPAHMNQFQNLPNTNAGDHGGVHVNSGIPNKAFYLFANSSGVTKEEAGLVYYRALTTYLTRNSQFIDCRLAVIKSAEDLFGGPGNAKALAAAAAFDAVGIGNGTATPPPPAQNPVTGTSYLTVLAISTGSLWRSDANGQNPAQVAATPVATRPTVTDNGQSIFFVDGTNNLRIVGSNGTGGQQLSTSGGFNNVSISPNGRYLAATSVFEEAAIYVFDLQNAAGNKVLQLYTPTYTQGVTTGAIRYPDRIDWTSDNATIMYDALNAGVVANGDTVEYWDINFVRLSDGNVARLFPSQPQGVNIGNPVFGSNSDNLIAFDFFQVGDSVRVLAVNLNNGDVGQVTNNVFSLGSPSFSNDDQKVYYHYITVNGTTVQSSVWVVDLAADGITGTGNDASILSGGYYPVSFTIGTRTTGAESEEIIPATSVLGQNFPNPFNPETRIGYRIQETGWVRLAVVDLLGREVAVLVDEEKPAGVYEAVFRSQNSGVRMASGVYFCRMTVTTAGGERFDAVKRMVMMK